MVIRILTTFLLLAFLSGMAFSTADAQTPNARQTEQTAKMRAKVVKRGVGERAKVRLYDDTRYDGTFREISDETFTIIDKLGNPHTVSFSQVRSVDGVGGGLSSGTKIAIGVVAGAAATIAVLAIIATSVID